MQNQNEVNLATVISELFGKDPPVSPMRRRFFPEDARKRARRIAEAVGPKYARATVENYQIYDKAQANVVSRLKHWLDNLDQEIVDGGGLLLWGTVGTGKDHLMAAAMFHAVLLRRYLLQWIEGTELHQRLRSFTGDYFDERCLASPLRNCQILAISDPIPPGRSLTPRGADILFSILDHRARHGLSTWATLNIGTAQEAEDRAAAALIDRLRHNSLVLKCDWESYRKRSAKRSPN